jgi:hypothetical protein
MHGRSLRAIPWTLALIGLAVPMVGSGFIGWPFVAGWLVFLLLLGWVRPLGGADRATRVGVGVGSLVGLAALGTVGGFYLIPAVIAWLVLAMRETRPEASATP